MDMARLNEQFDNWLNILKTPQYELNHSSRSLEFKIKDPEIVEPLFNRIDISFLSKSQVNQILLAPYGNKNIHTYWQQRNPELYATLKSDKNNLGTRLSALLNMDEFRCQDVLRDIVSTLIHVNKLEKTLSEGSLTEQKEYFSTSFPRIVSGHPHNGFKYMAPTNTLVNLMKAVQFDIAEAAKLEHKTPKDNPFRDKLSTIHTIQQNFNTTIAPLINVIEKGLHHTLESSDFNALRENIFLLPKTLRPLNLLYHHAAESQQGFNKISPLLNTLIKDYTDDEISKASEEIHHYIKSSRSIYSTGLQQSLATTVLPDNEKIISIITDTTLPNTYNALMDNDVAELVGPDMPIDYIIKATQNRHRHTDMNYPFMREPESDPKNFWSDFKKFKDEVSKITDIITYRHYLRTKNFDYDAPESDAYTRLMIKEIADCIYGLGLREVFDAYIEESRLSGKSINKITETNPVPMVGTGILASKHWLKKSYLDELTKETSHGRTLFDDIYLINDFAKEIAPHISIKGNMKPLLSIDNRVERMMSQILKKVTSDNIRDKDIDVKHMFENTL